MNSLLPPNSLKFSTARFLGTGHQVRLGSCYDPDTEVCCEERGTHCSAGYECMPSTGCCRTGRKECGRNAVQTAAMTPKRRYAAPTTEGLATRAGFVCKMGAAARDIRTVAQINATTLMSRSAANRGIVRGHVRVARSAVLPRRAAMILRSRFAVLLAHAVSLGVAVRMSAVTRMRNVVVMDTVRQ